jgi:hypothetical protein
MNFANANQFHRKSGYGPGAKRQPSPEGAGRRISKVAERRRCDTTFIRWCRASGAQTILGSMSQPFRAGLTFGSRPYRPGSDCGSFSRSHVDCKALIIVD